MKSEGFKTLSMSIPEAALVLWYLYLSHISFGLVKTLQLKYTWKLILMQDAQLSIFLSNIRRVAHPWRTLSNTLKVWDRGWERKRKIIKKNTSTKQDHKACALPYCYNHRPMKTWQCPSNQSGNELPLEGLFTVDQAKLQVVANFLIIMFYAVHTSPVWVNFPVWACPVCNTIPITLLAITFTI